MERGELFFHGDAFSQQRSQVAGIRPSGDAGGRIRDASSGADSRAGGQPGRGHIAYFVFRVPSLVTSGEILKRTTIDGYMEVKSISATS